MTKRIKGAAETDLEIVNAFKHVFKEHGKDAQVDLVLDELARFSGYYEVPGDDSTDLQYARDAGRREVFARILYLLGVSSEYREALRSAALRERELLSVEG